MLAYAGKGRFRIAPLDLGTLVSETTALLNVSVCKKVRMHIDLASDLRPVMADATQIQQIIMNLVINGSDAIGGKNCNHGGAVSEAAKKDHDAAKAARDAAKAAREAAREARKAAREAAKSAGGQGNGNPHQD